MILMPINVSLTCWWWPSLVRCICGHHELLSNDEYEDPYHDLIQCCSCSHYFHKSCVLYEIQHPHDLLGIQWSSFIQIYPVSIQLQRSTCAYHVCLLSPSIKQRPTYWLFQTISLINGSVRFTSILSTIPYLFVCIKESERSWMTSNCIIVFFLFTL